MTEIFTDGKCTCPEGEHMTPEGICKVCSDEEIINYDD